MKKLLRLISCALLACMMLLSCAGCELVMGKFFQKAPDKNVKCAPCTVREIWNFNQAACEEFFALKNVIRYLPNVIQCTVNGEEWDLPRQVAEDLEDGQYTIRFWTAEDFMLEVWVKDGEEFVKKNIPYQREITLTVEISSEYEDIYDFEYRQANGLWCTAEREEWYQACAEKWQKELKKIK